MPSPSRRPLLGLAALAVVGIVSCVPVTAHADPTDGPTPGGADAVTPSAASSPTAARATATPPTPSAGSSTVSTASSAPGTGTPAPAEDESARATGSPDPKPADDESGASTTPAPEDTEPTPTAPVGASGGDVVAGPLAAAAEQPAAQDDAVGAEATEPAHLSLAKTASPTRVSAVGQVVTYRFVATNDGAVDLSEVRISDELPGLGPLSCNRAAPVTLAAGQALSCTATLTVTQEDLDFGAIYNFGAVFGEAVGGDPNDPADDIGAVDDAEVSVDQQPSIALTASVSPSGTADRGDRLRYAATATNTGNVTLTSARISSSLDALDLSCQPSARATLAPGASISCTGSYRVTAADARRGRVSNELTARAEPPFGDPDDSSDDVTDDVRLRVAVTKPASSSSATDGGLADTGGPALPVGLVGVLAVAGGSALIRRARRG